MTSVVAAQPVTVVVASNALLPNARVVLPLKPLASILEIVVTPIVSLVLNAKVERVFPQVMFTTSKSASLNKSVPSRSSTAAALLDTVKLAVSMLDISTTLDVPLNSIMFSVSQPAAPSIVCDTAAPLPMVKKTAT